MTPLPPTEAIRDAVKKSVWQLEIGPYEVLRRHVEQELAERGMTFDEVLKLPMKDAFLGGKDEKAANDNESRATERENALIRSCYMLHALEDAGKAYAVLMLQQEAMDNHLHEVKDALHRAQALMSGGEQAPSNVELRQTLEMRQLGQKRKAAMGNIMESLLTEPLPGKSVAIERFETSLRNELNKQQGLAK